MRIVGFLAVVFLLAGPGFGESTINCSAGKIDVLDWMTLDQNLRSSKHMKGKSSTGSNTYLSTVVWSDKFYWLKHSSGDTWDINLYDNNWIYLWITENIWRDPFSYKRHYQNFNVKLAKRCAQPGLPGESQQIPDTGYRVANNCSESRVYRLKKGVTQFWGPYTAGQPGLESSRPAIGGDIPNNTTVYVVSWQWDCNNNYANCRIKEEYILTKKWGLVRWNEWSLQGGQYVLNRRVDFDDLVSGAATPYFPCF